MPIRKLPSVYKPYVGDEDSFQIAVARFLDIRGVLWTHPANERKTKVMTSKSGKTFSPEGALLKRKGVKRGVPDILIYEPRKGFVGFAIELKVGSNTVSEEQKFWLESLQKRGWKTLASWSLDEVISEIENYLS